MYEASKVRRIGILTAGGDAPGLNAVIRSVVKTATRVYGWTVVGIADGFEGLLDPATSRVLTLADVRGLLPRGGSILGCTNRGHFGIRMSEDRALKDDDMFARGARTVEQLELDALVVLGGDGSHRIAYELSKLGVRVVTIPKTIDNDLAETDLTFGFSSALDIAVEAVDRLHTTAESHGRVMVVEVMGRHAGWIALMAGLAGGADIILVPEIPFDLEKVAAKVRERVAGGSRFSIAVVAEGAKPAGGQEVYREAPAGADLGRLGGVGERVAAEITRRTGVESRAVVLGHVQRGGPPTPVDRILASCFGATAVHAIAAGRSADTVVWKDGEFVALPLERVVRGSKAVPNDHALVKVARDLGITFAGEVD